MEKIYTLKDIERNNAAQVVCTGCYRQHDVRKGGIKNTTPPQYYGHAVIQLDDGTKVMLYPIWHESCIRSPSEIHTFEGKRVNVTGRIYLEAPNVSEQHPVQNLMLPCILDIIEMKSAE